MQEARKLFGYPDDFVMPSSECRAYKQFGNSVAVPAVRAVAEQIKKALADYEAGCARAAPFLL